MLKRKKKLISGDKAFGYYMLIPALVMFFTFSIYPLLRGIYISFTDFSILNPLKGENFVFLDNYIKTLTEFNSGFYQALIFTIIFSLSVCVLSYLLGLGLALILNRDFKFRGVFRGLLLLPWVIPPTVYSTNWRWVLNDKFGLINNFLLNINMIQKPILFLSDIFNAKLTVIFIGAWRSYPFMLLMILAGLQSIPDDLYEAAKIDGANRFQIFSSITFPLLRNVSIICTVIMFLWTFNSFEHIYLLTGGGPTTSTTVLSILIYNTAFFRGRFGYAAAIAVLNLILLLIISIFYLKKQRNIYL